MTTKLVAKFTACVVACLFFLSWAMQTVWLASFPGRDAQSAALHFYLQLGAAIAFAVAAVWVVWKWRRHRKHGQLSDQ
jgi:membrane protein implicated in regulation of membrane protease activity